MHGGAAAAQWGLAGSVSAVREEGSREEIWWRKKVGRGDLDERRDREGRKKVTEKTGKIVQNGKKKKKTKGLRR